MLIFELLDCLIRKYIFIYVFVKYINRNLDFKCVFFGVKWFWWEKLKCRNMSSNWYKVGFLI